MREILSIVLFLLAIGGSAAAVMGLISIQRMKMKHAIIWTVVLSLLWGAWYVAQ